MTPLEVKTAALREIGAVSFNETAPAEEYAAAGEKYELLHAMLLEQNLATWALTEDIPDKCSMPVVWMLANLLTSTLGASEADVMKYQALGSLNASQLSLAERQLRRIVAADYVPQTATAEYF
jgi:hypothetical protein